MPLYNILKQRMTGTTHEKEKSPCQDAVANHAYGDLACMVVADGAGQARYGLDGAELVCSVVIDRLKSVGTDIVEWDPDDLRTMLMNNLTGELKKKQKELGCELSDLASTVAFMVTDGNRYVAGNLGDGIFGYVDERKNGILVIGQERGLYANQTWFVTSSDAADHLRIKRDVFNPQCTYFLLTDGSVDCLYNHQTSQFAPMLKTFCDWLQRYKYNKVQPFVRDAMYKFFPNNTTDDCALGLLTTLPGRARTP